MKLPINVVKHCYNANVLLLTALCCYFVIIAEIWLLTSNLERKKTYYYNEFLHKS